MRYVEFEGAPSVALLLEKLEDRFGRFALENVPEGKAIVGAVPDFVLTYQDGAGILTREDNSQRLNGDPFDILRQHLASFSDVSIEGDVPFAGGAVGYFSYDLGRHVEVVPSTAREDIPTPDYALGFYDSALCIDAKHNKCIAVSKSGDLAALDFWRKIASECPPDIHHAASRREPILGSPKSNFTKQAYLEAVQRIRDYIAAGDVYQVNLAQRFEAEIACKPVELYNILRQANPATNGCYIELGGPTLLCASPETFLQYDACTMRIVTKPIKGTRPRGLSASEDARLASELAASEKDRAENLMIVDMLRNDLGRVAKYGTVEVPKLWDIEAHPTVFQMVSTVEAVLDQAHDTVDLLKACYPGGSITGAPKIRAMEIIEELEPVRRGMYTGAAGYFDCRGHVDLNIVIRSFVVDGSTAYFHGGGGIVIDSDPQMEYQETLDKIAGLQAALARCGVPA